VNAAAHPLPKFNLSPNTALVPRLAIIVTGDLHMHQQKESDVSPKRMPPICTALVVAPLLVSLGSGTAFAQRENRQAASVVHRVSHRARVVHSKKFVSRVAPAYGDNSWIPYRRFTPGYIPGRGIPGEDCNMPSSTCSNEYRDVQ
jgi:hypothetical protein